MSKLNFKDLNFVADNTINLIDLEQALNSILEDAKKCNKGNGAAGRRFRLNTVKLGKSFLKMRSVTPVK